MPREKWLYFWEFSVYFATSTIATNYSDNLLDRDKVSEKTWTLPWKLQEPNFCFDILFIMLYKIWILNNTIKSETNEYCFSLNIESPMEKIYIRWKIMIKWSYCMGISGENPNSYYKYLDRKYFDLFKHISLDKNYILGNYLVLKKFILFYVIFIYNIAKFWETTKIEWNFSNYIWKEICPAFSWVIWKEKKDSM